MKKLIFNLSLLFVITVAIAEQQIVKASDGAVIKISTSQPNLIEASNGKIAAFVFTEGMFTQTIDDAAGVVYFRPINLEPRSGFVEVINNQNQRKRYSLMLIPDENQSAKRIVINDHELTKKDNLENINQDNNLTAIKTLMRSMLIDEEKLAVKNSDEKILIGKLTLTKLATWEQDSLIGEKYKLKNNQAKNYELNESEFVFNQEIIAIAALKNSLDAFAETDLFIIKVNQNN